MKLNRNAERTLTGINMSKDERETSSQRSLEGDRDLYGGSFRDDRAGSTLEKYAEMYEAETKRDFRKKATIVSALVLVSSFILYLVLFLIL